MKTELAANAPMSLDELESYAVPEQGAAPSVVAPATTPTPEAQAAAPAVMTPEELAGYEDTSRGANDTPAPVAPERVQMLRKGQSGDELVDVAPGDVERAYTLGYRLDPSEVAGQKAIHLRDAQTGEVETFEQGDPEAQQKLAQGAMVATPEEVSAEYGDLGSQAATAAEGVLQGASLGLYGLAADKLAGQGYRAARQLREEENPVTSVVSNVVGAAAPALLTGGATAEVSGAELAARGAVATAARAAAAATPAARLARLGTSLAEHLGVGAAKAGLGAAGRIGASAIAAAGEAAFDNAARRVADDLGAGDVDITAERMLGAAWDGAKLGAIFGGSASALGEGASYVAGRLRARAATKAERAVQEATERAEERAQQLAAQMDVPAPDAVRPRAEIDADLDAVRSKLDAGDHAGGKAEATELEDQLAELIQEQEKSTMAAQAMTPDAAFANAMEVELPKGADGILARIDQNLNKAKNAREIKSQLTHEADQLSRSITTDLDELSRFDTNTLAAYTNRSNKPKVIRAMLEQDGVERWTPEVAGKILSRVDKMEATLDSFSNIDEHTIYGKQALHTFKAGKDALAKLRQHLTNLRGSGPIAPGSRIMRGTIDDVAQSYHALDLFKSHLGSFAATLGPRPATTSEATFQRLYMLLRSDLQDPKLFGPALAEMQTVTNAAVTRDITKSRLFQQMFGRSGVSEKGGHIGAFSDVLEFDPKKVGSMLENLADPRAYKDARDFMAGLTAKVERMEAMARYYPMPEAAKAEIAAARATLDNITAKMRATKELAVKSAEAERLAAQTNNVHEIITGLRALPLGSTLAAAASTATAVTRGIASSLVALGKSAAQQEQAAVKAAREAVKTLIKEAPTEAEATTAKALAAQAARARTVTERSSDVPRHLAGIGITASALKNAISDARALQDPTSKESLGLQAQVEDIAAESPELAQAVAAKVRAKADFIVSKVGPELDTTDPFRPKPRLVDPVTERSAARYIEAARNPLGAFTRLAHGTATKEDKETLQALYPERFAKFRDAVLANVKEMKVPPSMAQRQRLFFATGAPLSREMDPAYLQRRSRERQQQAQPKKESASPALQPMVTPSKAKTEFKADQHFASRSDAILAGTDN